MNQTHTFAVVLAGGGGTRLWPKSRNVTPKQFLKLTGSKTMMQIAAERLSKLVPWDHIIVVTNQLYLEEVKLQLPEVPAQNIIAEPEKRETALAMLAGALFAKAMDPEAVIINAASDHVVLDEAEFIRVMNQAATIAATEAKLITVGITPTYAHTGFGYIESGVKLKDLAENLPLLEVKSFREKPDFATAQAFIKTGKYYWNANMYVWKATHLKAAFAKYLPKLYAQTEQLDTLNPESFHQALPAIYSQAPSISIDYAISEKADNLVLIPGDFGWNDVGDWRVVHDLSAKDDQQNVLMSDSSAGKILALHANQNLVNTTGKLVALAYVNDLIVVDTPEILLIINRDHSQEIKKIVEELKKTGATSYL
ncbi:MAG TPA: mannose-1-phosphate guanylyltransferase [Candidatus Pacebacteria bacterium]|nr:mannose-1-phosphate guanylyltransferase [Candidatus Paceibacterota bacterium]